MSTEPPPSRTLFIVFRTPPKRNESWQQPKAPKTGRPSCCYVPKNSSQVGHFISLLLRCRHPSRRITAFLGSKLFQIVFDVYTQKQNKTKSKFLNCEVYRHSFEFNSISVIVSVYSKSWKGIKRKGHDSCINKKQKNPIYRASCPHKTYFSGSIITHVSDWLWLNELSFASARA